MVSCSGDDGEIVPSDMNAEVIPGAELDRKSVV